ncbi:unnamed protein product [Owenia fusiformis]|uniref:Uncharacterized protein n=1 Tax=Owenia fusiformis TaxID=6347 RepID=A0A8S4MXA2_OWEFU|nr:unnamed protein product [Owenia fusiformis]
MINQSPTTHTMKIDNRVENKIKLELNPEGAQGGYTTDADFKKQQLRQIVIAQARMLQRSKTQPDITHKPPMGAGGGMYQQRSKTPTASGSSASVELHRNQKLRSIYGACCGITLLGEEQHLNFRRAMSSKGSRTLGTTRRYQGGLNACVWGGGIMDQGVEMIGVHPYANWYVTHD